MRKYIYTFLVILSISSISKSQNLNLPVTFESTTTNYGLTDFGGNTSAVVVDPVVPSNKVGRVIKSNTAELWAGTTIGGTVGFVTPVPFNSTTTKISMRVYSPNIGIVVRLKIEDSNDASKSVETDATTTVANAWHTLEFNFANHVNGTSPINYTYSYKKASVFFNFGVTGAVAGTKTYYFDDVTLMPSTSSLVDLPVNFDSTNTNYGLLDFVGNTSSIAVDPLIPSNKVCKIIKSNTAQTLARTTIGGSTGFANAVAFNSTRTKISMRVYSPNAGTVVRLKLEDPNDATKSVETEATTSLANAWHTLEFNFANQAIGTPALNYSYTYKKATVYFNYGVSGATAGTKTYYFDDLTLMPAILPVDLPVSFESTTINYGLTDFGGNSSAVVVDPIVPANKVGRIIKPNTAELWAGTTIGGTIGFATAIAFAPARTIITMRVYSPDSGIVVKLKVEDPNDGTKSVETDTRTTVANAWQTLSFNFATQATGTQALNYNYVYKKASVFFNFGVTGAAAGTKTYYFDDLTLMPPIIPNITFSVNMSQFGQAFDSVYVSGTWNSWSGNSQGLVRQGTSNIWQGTFSIPSGNQEYKFTVDNWNYFENFPNPLPCTITTGQYTNRAYNVTGNATLPTVCWQSCNTCVIPVTSLQDTTIAYKVDSVLLDGGANYSSYLWSTGDTTRTIWVKNNAKVNLRVSDNQYGLAYGFDSTLVIFINGIEQNDTAICSGNPVFINAGSNLSSSLVAYFPFNGNPNDASVNGNNGINYGATLTNDRFGNANSAYSFNGSNNYIQIPNASSLVISDQITLSSWFNINSYNSNYFPILCKSTHASNHGLFNLGVVPNAIYSYLNGQGGGLAVSNVNLNQWYHLVTTIGNGSISYYLNGVFIGTQNCQSQPGGIGGPISSDPLIIGKDVPGQTEWTNGKLDDIGIWNKALTSAEVKSIYNIGSANSKVKWSTGDTSFSIKAIPTSTTTYTCTQTIGSFSFTDSITITVKQTPKADFSINSPEVQCFKGNSFNFVDISNDSGLVTNRYWYFGDDSISTDSNVSKSFQIDTILGLRYSNWLVKVADNGCSDTIMKTVDVWPNPKASYAVDKYSQCFKGNAFSFTDTSWVPSGPISRQWDFGDGNFSTTINPTTSYQSSSSYKVKLTVTAYNNCIDTITKTIIVNPTPMTGFIINKDTQCLNGNSFNLTDTSKIDSGNFSKLWNFGTGLSDTSSKSLISKVYTTVNSYNIKYIATSDFGCIDSIEKTVTVLPSPNPAGQIAGKTNDLQTATPYLYNINQQTGVTYNWIVNNAAIISGQGTNAVTLQWINNGMGKLTVVITNPSGCTDTSSITVGVGTQPSLVSFTPTSAKSGETVTINGFNLNNATAVKFGGVNAQFYNVISSNKIEAIVGNGSSGDVTVITPSGNISLAGFTYLTSTGIESTNTFSGLLIYPNPTKQLLTIDFGNIKTQGDVNLQIHDMLGRLVYGELLHEQSIDEYTISVSGLSTGNYILTLKTNDKIEHIKFIKE